MKGIDVVIDVLLSLGDKVPTIVEGDAVAVLEIETQTQIGVAAREELGKSVVFGHKDIKSVGHPDAITHIGKVRTVDNAHQRQIHLAVGGQPIVRLVSVVSEIALSFPNHTEATHKGKVGRCILQVRDLANVTKSVDVATDPLVPTATLRVMDTIEEVVVDVVVQVSATRINQGSVDVTKLQIRLKAFPFIGGARILDVGNTWDEEWNRAVVVGIGDATASSHVQVQGSFRSGLGKRTEAHHDASHKK